MIKIVGKSSEKLIPAIAPDEISRISCRGSYVSPFFLRFTIRRKLSTFVTNCHHSSPTVTIRLQLSPFVTSCHHSSPTVTICH